MKETYLFISSYNYLSLPHYISILPYLTNSNNVYLHIHDPVTFHYDSYGYIKTYEIWKKFNSTLDLNENLVKRQKNSIHYNRILSTKQLVRTKIKINKFLDKLNPNVIIAGSDVTISDRIIMNWSLKHKIPFLILQTALLIDEKPKTSLELFLHLFKYTFFNKILQAPFYSKQLTFGLENKKTHLLLWSKYFTYNHKRPNTHFVGNPYFDKFFTSEKIDVSFNNKILICTEPIDTFWGTNYLLEIIDIYKSAIRSLEKYEFLIKIHPRETIQKYEKFFDVKEFPNVKIVKNIEFNKIVRTCQIQSSINSYSSLEAAAMGVPVITVTPDDVYEKLDDLFKGIINIRAKSDKDFVKAVEYFSKVENYQLYVMKKNKYFKKLLTNIQGTSSFNIAAFIESFRKNSKI